MNVYLLVLFIRRNKLRNILAEVAVVVDLFCFHKFYDVSGWINLLRVFVICRQMLTHRTETKVSSFVFGILTLHSQVSLLY